MNKREPDDGPKQRGQGSQDNRNTKDPRKATPRQTGGHGRGGEGKRLP